MTTTKWCDTCGEQVNDEHACNEWSIPMTRKNTIHLQVNSIAEGRLACDSCDHGSIVIDSVVTKWESLMVHDGRPTTNVYEYADTHWNNHVACDSCEEGPSETMVDTVKKLMPGMEWAAKPKTMGMLIDEYGNANPESQSDDFDPEKPITCPQCGHDTVGFWSTHVSSEAVFFEITDGAATLEMHTYEEPTEEVGSSLQCGYCGAIMGAKRRDWIVENFQ